MNRLFRKPNARLTDYAALALFAAAYLATMAIVLAPATFDLWPPAEADVSLTAMTYQAGFH